MVVGQGGMAITEVAVLHVAGEWNIYIGFVIIHIQLMVARTVDKDWCVQKKAMSR